MLDAVRDGVDPIQQGQVTGYMPKPCWLDSAEGPWTTSTAIVPVLTLLLSTLKEFVLSF